MKRLTVLVALIAAALVVVAGSAVAAGGKTSVIYDSTVKNGPASDKYSAGPEAYSFTSIGDTITFAAGPRKLTNVVVSLSSWGCVTGAWNSGDCSTPTGATFAQAITLTVTTVDGTPLGTATQTFNVAYRPSASAKCTGPDAGKWYSSALRRCFYGYPTDVTFTLPGNVTLPDTVKYGISYNTSHAGPNPVGDTNPCNSSTAGCPYDSLNVALNSSGNQFGSPNPYGPDTIGAAAYDPAETVFGYPFTPAVQFKAGGGS